MNFRDLVTRKTAEINKSPGNGNLRESVLDLTVSAQPDV
jgi:hypothetical protein